MQGSRAKKIVFWVLSPVMLLAGIALIASFFLAGRLDSTATNSEDPGGFNVPRLETTQGNEETTEAAGPEDKTLKLTVPAMSRIEDDEIPSTTGTTRPSSRSTRPSTSRAPASRGRRRRTCTSPATAWASPTRRAGSPSGT
jgi:sortase A